MMRIAVIGGNGHHSLLALAGKEDGVQVVAVASDGRDENALRFKESPWWTGDTKYYDDYRKMLDEVKPELVSVGCQFAFNGQACIAALERGINAVSDKPIANSDEELQRLHELTGDGNRHVIAEFTMRWYPDYYAAHQAIRLGSIGEPVLIQAQKSYRFGDARPDFYKKRETYSGSVLWVTSHAFDFVAWTTGLDYRSVTGLGGNLAKPDYGEMEDHVALLCEMSNGASCVIHGDYLRPAKAPTHGDDRLRVAGSQGVIEVREGMCILITNEAEQQILEMTPPNATDTARGLLAAAKGESDARITTEECLRLAEVLLKARDATDRKAIVAC